MCMLLHRYTVFVILFVNWIPFYNSGSVFDHIPVSIYALKCYMYLSWALITICIVVELLFVYNDVFLFLCVTVQDVLYSSGRVVETCLLIWRRTAMFFVGRSYDLDLDLDINPFFFVTTTHCMLTYIRLYWRFRRFFGVLCRSQLPK